MPPHWLRDRHVSEQELVTRGLGTLNRDDPLWPGQVAILAALVLYLFLPNALTIGPRWPLPVAEGVLLASLVFAARRGLGAKRRRAATIGIALFATVINLISLGVLVHYLLAGGRARGANLLGGGVIIWTTSLLLFAVVYWELDRGGPQGAAVSTPAVVPDFLFPQMSDSGFAPPGWKPGFPDYLYLSLTNQTAFSPTDVMPLSWRLKALMGIQGTAALVTVGVIIARAVNILA